MAHREVVGVTFVLYNPLLSLLSPTAGRKINPRIGIAEALQLIAGESYPGLMSSITSVFDRYRDGQVLHGAYGPRIRTQMPRAIDMLSHNTGTRQAYVAIWNPLVDQDDRADIPCTTGFQFLLRDGRLHMVVNMRSNDAWLGFPYDVFQFTYLQKTVAWCLGAMPGTYTHNVGSMHLYEENIDDARIMLATGSPAGCVPIPGLTQIGQRGVDFRESSVLQTWNKLTKIANCALKSDASRDPYLNPIRYALHDGAPYGR